MLQKINLGLVIVLAIALWWSWGHSNPKADSSTTIRIYNETGTEISGAHAVMGNGAFTLGTKTFTLTGAAVFTNSSSYQCAFSDTTGVNATAYIRNSGSSFTVNGIALSTDGINYICVGN
jgi:hypothetical protein